MSVTEYVFKGTADMSQHDRALRQSADQVYQYKKRVENATGTLGSFGSQVGKMGGTLGSFGGRISSVAGSFMKLNPYILGASAAIAGVAQVVRSNEEMMDKWQSNIQGINGSYQSLLSTLSRGDWSNVWNNFWTAQYEAKQAYEAADNFDTYSAFNKQHLKTLTNEIAELQNEMYDAQREGREEDLKDLKAKLKEKNDIYKSELAKEKSLAEKQARTSLTSTILSNDILTNSQIEYLASVYLSSGKGFADLKAKYEENLKRGLKKNSTSFMSFASQALANEEKLRESYIENIALVQQYDEQIQQAERSSKRFLKMEATKKSSGGSTSTPKELKFGSEEWLDKLYREEDITADGNLYSRWFKHQIETLKYEADKAVHEQFQKDKNGNKLRPVELLVPVEVEIDDDDPEVVKQIANSKVWEAMEQLNEAYERDHSPISVQMDFYKRIYEDETKSYEERLAAYKKYLSLKGELVAQEKQQQDVLLDSVNKFGSALKSASSTFEMPILNVAGTIAQAIANMILSYTTAVAQASKLGPVAWASFAATGLAETLSIIAALKSAGTFANGGIVGGTTTVGDYNLARVNKGEMILNQREQTRLWHILNGVGVGSLENQLANVQFHISGNDLVGTLANYNSKKNRVL